MKNRAKTIFLCQGAIIAAIYVVLTYITHMFGLDSGVIQIRVSEMLCVLPMFTTAAIPGLYLGCLLANLLTGAVWLDVIAGPVATLIGAIGTYALRRWKWVAPLPPIAANTLIIPFVLSYSYGMEQAIPFMMLTVGIGEILSIYLLGMIFYFAIRKRAKNIFQL
jgi:uncharacterized membrane protein